MKLNCLFIRKEFYTTPIVSETGTCTCEEPYPIDVSSFNDDETRSGTITITNGDGKWVRKRNLDHLDICEPGLDELDRISGMTLEEYREDKLTVIRFS